MARTRTLAEIRAEVRQRADIEGDTHVTDAEINRYVNQSIARLHGLVVQQSEDDYVTSAAIATVAGTSSYALAAAFYKLRSVEVTINNVVRQMDRFTWEERARYQNVNTWGLATQPIAYRLIGSTIHFAPTPDAVYAVTVWYVSASVDLVVDADTYDGRDGWEEWVVLDAAVKCKLKSEEDIRDLVGERDRVLGDITKAMGTKDDARPESVTEVIPRGYDPYGMSPVWRR